MDERRRTQSPLEWGFSMLRISPRMIERVSHVLMTFDTSDPTERRALAREACQAVLDAMDQDAIASGSGWAKRVTAEMEAEATSAQPD